MSVFLRAGVHGAVIGDDLALLDLKTDGYLCLPGGAECVRRSRAGELVLEAGAGASAIIHAGLATNAPGPQVRRLPPVPQGTIIHEALPRLSVRQVLRALVAARDVSMALRQPGLGPILDVAGQSVRSADRTRVVEAARAFWRIVPWMPLEGECLVRSATLVSFLRRSGLSADWVFGVRLWPFSAHCWVQIGDICLNDDVERLAAYTPIYCR